MTFQPGSEEEGGDGEPNPGSYQIGYRRPPPQHQFKKGRSGNPHGRPRKGNQRRKAELLGLGVQPAGKYLLEEAYRPVLVREGEITIELPAIQAVFRAMGVAAMKGNRFAQRTLAQLVQSVEAEDRQIRTDHLESAIQYKCNWEEAIERARELGRPEPQPIPHPDDIFIDFVNGDAHVCGPLTKDDKVKWDRLLDHMDHMQTEISDYAATYRKSRSEKRKEWALDLWIFEQKLFDRLNDNLPQRYRKTLKDRCWQEGATRPGQQRKRIWPDEQ